MDTRPEIRALKMYAETLKREKDILLSWYIQTLENYDGLSTQQDLEREVLIELKKACGG